MKYEKNESKIIKEIQNDVDELLKRNDENKILLCIKYIYQKL
jgi:hypothetical protein